MLGVIWPEYGHNCSTNRLESTRWGRMHAAVLQLPDARMLLCSVAMLQCFAQKSEIWKHAPRPPSCRLAHGDTSQHGAEMRGYCMQFSWGLCVGLRQKDERNPIKYLLYSPHSRTIINPHMTFTPPAVAVECSLQCGCWCARARLPAPVHCWDMSWSGSQLHSIVNILLREQNQDGQDQLVLHPGPN